MFDISSTFFTTVTSGLVFSHNWKINIIRITVYLSLVAIFLIPYLIDLNQTGKIFFTLGISGFIFLIKFFLYLMNKLVDKSIEVSSSSANRKPLVNDDRPPSIPGPLWDRRFDYINGRGLTNDDVINLMTSGFDPDAVFEFHRIMQNSDFLFRQSIAESPNSSIPESKNFIKICGHLIPLPFHRKTINSIFPANESLLYVILATIFSCIMSFAVSNTKNYACWVFGPAIYSLLHPLETDPYSTTRGDIYSGTTRSFYVSLVLGIQAFFKYLAENVIHTKSEYFHVNIDWVYIFDLLNPYLNYSLYLLPILILFFVGHPMTITSWIFEFGGRYLFGLGGSTGIIHSILQFLKSVIIASINGIILNVLFHKNQQSNNSLAENEILSRFDLKCIGVCICIGISTLLIQIPISYQNQLRQEAIKFIISIIIISIISVSFAFIGALVDYHIVSIVCCSLSLLFDILWPYTSSNNGYILFHFRCFSHTSKIVNILRLITPSILAPMLISSLTVSDKDAPLAFISILIVCCINRSFIESHIFAISLLMFVLFDRFEFYMISSRSHLLFLLFISLCISRKLFSSLPILDYYRRIRPQVLCDIELGEIIWNFVCGFFWNYLPGPDRSLHFPSVIFSLITGSPINSPGLITFLCYPSAPRPNYFWELNNGQSIDPKTSFTARLTEHPIETPVYNSATRALSLTLSPLIKSGRLGIVDSNDIFLFKNDTMAAFVHIVACEPHCVKFQLRGLEYTSETTCHRGEISSIQRVIDDYTLFPNILAKSIFYTTNWEIRAINVPFQIYAASNITLERAFMTLDNEMSLEWATIAFAYICTKKSQYINTNYIPLNTNNTPNTTSNNGNDVLNQALVFEDTINEDNIGEFSQLNIDIQYKQLFYDCLSMFGGFNDPNLYNRASLLWSMLYHSLFFENGDLDLINLIHLFNEEKNLVEVHSQQFSGDQPFISQLIRFGPQENEQTLIYKAVRFATLLFLMAANGISPNGIISDRANEGEVVSFVKEMDEEYTEAPINSKKFAQKFQEEKKDLITIISRDGLQTSILNFQLTTNSWNVFAIQRESVRSFWASEAFSQLFFNENSSERRSIQMDDHFLHNLIVQSCNIPIGYPALVSPILTSYAVPPSLQMF
ncbi:hypothetical protein TRFO_18002 [Tritrichomonas foetus]|uniref:Pecanex C-terminal domain-containing protein n=1 Tax=Tritrichomonas foetus TaxID=1144522 RepID=A0A1J4KLX1_9EUKA|nr:hypothetical protein TRFO_18002 [Tritrichomonas foetus]|eukprot:OHT12297.1 hypothetical protein TRFO_18002 [Tritrichomonas foetus]